MSNIVPFVFKDSLVRAVEKDGELWFVGKDVCAVLEIKKHHQALDRLDPDERGTCTTGTPGGIQEMIVVSEPGVFRLIFRSRKPQAEEFMRWLAHEVLPALRKHGFFGMKGVASSDTLRREARPSETRSHASHQNRLAHWLAVRAEANKRLAELGVPLDRLTGGMSS